MRKTIIAATVAVLIAGLSACATQQGYGPGFGYGPSYGYSQPYGYGQGQPVYGQSAPAPLVQMFGGGLTPNGGGYGNQGYYSGW
jgi:hypothetical protein